MDHHYFGIRNILALRGDPPDGQPLWKPREGGYDYAYQLIEQIVKLNAGEYLPRPGGPAPEKSSEGAAEKTDFCIGAAAYPEFPDERKRLEYFKLKVDAGAVYGITDMLFDVDAYSRFRDLCAGAGLSVPILPGTRLLKSRAQAERMMSKFKVSVPAETLAQLPEEGDPDAVAKSVALFLKMVERLKSVGAPGIHLYVIGDTSGACAALHELTHHRSKELGITPETLRSRRFMESAAL